MRKSFLLHTDSLDIFDELSDEQIGQLFRLIREYHNPSKPNTTQITQVVKLVFYPFKSQFDRDLGKYESIVNRNKINGKLGGRPIKNNPSKPKKADSDNVNESKNDSDNESKNVSVKKEKVKVEPIILVYPFTSEKFLNAWSLWNRYRAEIKKPYKSKLSEQGALKDLGVLSGQNEDKAVELIEYAISKAWQGIYKPNISNGKQTSDEIRESNNDFLKRAMEEPGFWNNNKQ